MRIRLEVRFGFIVKAFSGLESESRDGCDGNLPSYSDKLS